jgi:poly(A) polymerase
MISFIKKLLKIKPTSKKVSPPIEKTGAIVIPREQHRISKTNISVNALKVLNRLHHSGYEACLVGGSVRDLLLGIAPKDFDVATNAKPHEVNRLFRNSLVIGRRFRIVHVQFGREIIEVTTFRGGEEHHEEGHIDHKKDHQGMIIRDNIFGDISQDAKRRDFTVNALYYNIADFSIIDFTRGYQDLKDKVIRLIGDPEVRYKEDPVRILRAIRFSAKLDFTLHSETAKPIKKLIPLIKNVPSARLSEEIFKVYHNGAAQKGHQLLCDYGLFDLFFPAAASALNTSSTHAKREESRLIGHKIINQALENTDHRFAARKPIMPAFLLAALLWHPMQQEIRRFKQEGDTLLEALEKSMSHIIHMQNQAVAIPKRYWQAVREIWVLQYRFSRRHGPRAFRLLQHPRFRAAYDFLLIRALAGDESVDLADWWTTFQEVPEEEQDAMVKALPPPKNLRSRKK